MDTKSLGRKLKAYRAKRGWTLNECAERIGISTRYLSDIERGDKVPKLETFITILNTLSASADDVLQDSLVMGYVPQSAELVKELDRLDEVQRKQAMDILRCVVTILSKG